MDIIKQLEVVFRQTDAVMEPNIFDALKKYMAAGGNCSSAVQDLSDGYQGVWCADHRASSNASPAPRADWMTVLIAIWQAMAP